MLNKIKSKIQREGIISAALAAIKYPFRLRFRKEYNQMLQKKSLKIKFTDINSKNLWSSKESVSGEGSEYNYTTNLRAWLINKIKGLDVKNFVDAPCGDFNWMRHVCNNVDIDYLGLDIVDEIINCNNNLYSTSEIKFKVANICNDKIPDCDILMVRDCLFHLSYDDINNFLKNISSTKFKYLLTTTHIVDKSFTNKDIISGDFRLINLFLPPFNFNSSLVIDRVDDYPAGHRIPREMVLVEKHNVPLTIHP